METATITDLRELRRPSGVEHAWVEGDNAALDGVRRTANPHTGAHEHLAEAWDLGHRGIPLPEVNRHWVEVMTLDSLQTVSSLRAQCGAPPWTTGLARHRRDDREAARVAVAA
jgi:hypothetical protein